MLWRRDMAADLAFSCKAVATAGSRSFLFMVLLLCGLYDFFIDWPLRGFPKLGSWSLDFIGQSTLLVLATDQLTHTGVKRGSEHLQGGETQAQAQQASHSQSSLAD